MSFYTPLANTMSALPYRATRTFLNFLVEEKVKSEVPQDSIVYVWPSIDPSIVEVLKERGCKIVYEMINVPTVNEKEIIENEMEREGWSYHHYVTLDKIRDQRKMLSLADQIFVSNPLAEQYLKVAKTFAAEIVSTNYGSKLHECKANFEAAAPTFIFVGRVCLEKGVHHLLRAWGRSCIKGKLRLFGRVDRGFARRYSDLLDLDGVEICGFQRDINRHYRDADCFVFLSLSEGGPQVTIEAASHGLPMIVSQMGGGRIAKHLETAIVVDPFNVDEVAEAMVQLAQSKSLRAKLGKTAWNASRNFTWEDGALKRSQSMHDLLETRVKG